LRGGTGELVLTSSDRLASAKKKKKEKEEEDFEVSLSFVARKKRRDHRTTFPTIELNTENVD